MTRAQFWGEKILTADKISQQAVRNCWDGARVEIVNTWTENDVTFHRFTDGSVIKATPVELSDGSFGHITWTV